MKQMLKVLTIFAVIGLLGWSEDIPRPAPLITEAEARSFLPMLRLLYRREQKGLFSHFTLCKAKR